MKYELNMDDCNTSKIIKSRLQNKILFFKTKSEGNLLTCSESEKAVFQSPLMRRNAETESNPQINATPSRSASQNNLPKWQSYWSEDAEQGQHLWNTLPVQSSECYIGERDCLKTGDRRVCASCDIIMHTNCIPQLQKINFKCKPTFREQDFTKHSSSSVLHHWVHRWRQEGKCNACSKSFQQKFLARDKEVIAIACSWCKQAYHNKQSCFSIKLIEEECDMGSFKDIIVPPTWIIKTSRYSARKKGTVKRKRKSTTKDRSFLVRPMGSARDIPKYPLLILVNPKSGGTKGAKILSSLYGYLNPRQIFDITTFKGPRYALETYRRSVHRLRVLVCGGDGTIGWVLSTLDSLKWPTYPPLGILPLGTGNDLARTLGWGGAYGDEQIPEILSAISDDSVVTHLDRWNLNVEPHDTEWNETVLESAEAVVRKLPLHVMNNYFSIGADAAVALQFHQSRSANPDLFNSRFKNRLMYGHYGTVDLFKRTWKDLLDFISLECDGIDITNKIREGKFHCLLFLNIPRYAGGTSPWGPSSTPTATLEKSYINKEFTPNSFNDGKVEVLGFTAATLAAIQVGGRGERIAQCSRLKITTSKPIPCQVDGEPCRLAPSIITMSYHSKVPMLQKIHRCPTRKCDPELFESESSQTPLPENIDCRPQFTALLFRLPVLALPRIYYNQNKSTPKTLHEIAREICVVDVDSEMELDKVRQRVDDMVAQNLKSHAAPWYFIDVTHDDRAYRVAFGQEKSLCVADVSNTEECILLAHDGLNPYNTYGLEVNDVNSPMPMRKINRKKPVMRIVLSSENEGTIL